VSLPVLKKQRTEGHPSETGASTPSQVGEVKADQPSAHQSGSRSSGEQTLARQAHQAPFKGVGVATPVVSGASSLIPRPSANFIKVDPSSCPGYSQILGLGSPWGVGPPKGLRGGDGHGLRLCQGVMAVAECWRLGGLVSRYQRRWKRLQADLEGRKTEKKEL